MEDAIEIAKKADGPVIFSDAADATSSVAPGTSNVILKGFLQSDYTGRVLFPIRDEPAVEKAMETGIGHTIIVSLGGTKDSRFIPLEVEVMVEMLSTGNYFSRDGRMENAGFLAVLRAKNITIVVSTQSGVLCDYSMYLGLGQDPKKFDVIICNYANADMVGHTGVISAAVKAIETVDECLGKIEESLRTEGGNWIITADHGNADLLVDPETGLPHTYHTTFPVPLIVVSDFKGPLKTRGSLRDIAPTILGLLGLPTPKEMTGQDLRDHRS